MSLRATLWRVLLCIGLVLNGSAYAGTSAPLLLQLGQDNAVQLHGHAEPPCHGQHDATPAKPMARTSVLSGSLPDMSGHASPDCCHAGSCGSLCMQQVQVQAASNLFHVASAQLMAGFGHGTSGHVEPVLPSLIRPPIS